MEIMIKKRRKFFSNFIPLHLSILHLNHSYVPFIKEIATFFKNATETAKKGRKTVFFTYFSLVKPKNQAHKSN